MKTLLKFIFISIIFVISFIKYTTKLNNIFPVYISTGDLTTLVHADKKDLVVFSKDTSNLNNSVVLYKTNNALINSGVAFKVDNSKVYLLNEKNEFIIKDISEVKAVYFGVIPYTLFILSVFDYPILILLMLIPSVLYIYNELNFIYSEVLKRSSDIAPIIIFKYYRFKYKVITRLSKVFNKQVRFHHGK